ncbi:hypothetical protein N1851_015334 [Merluccius polli]|uniref:Uncharacterized protein n=1 Tax=Merluccius polli TaxID=89951 RepID=A0AA47P2A8_MERPO|nr:hypothetical protein N1851_015334 [Merluccius polli]
MDATLWINGRQNYQVQRQNSQQPQQFWNVSGCSNTYPQYSEVNNPQSAQLNPGYGAYCSGQTSNHQTSTSQQLPTNTGYSYLPNHFVHGNTSLQTSFNDAQTRNSPWQDGACQLTTRQEPTSTGYGSNQRLPNMTAQTATFPLQNMQYSISSTHRQILNPVKLNYPQQSVQTTVPQNAYKESNVALVQTSQSATPSKQMEATTKKEDARRKKPLTLYSASTQRHPPPYIVSKTQMPPSKRSSGKAHDATFDSSSGQLPGSQTHLPLQSGVQKAPAFSNSRVYLAPPSNNTRLSSANNGQLPQTSHLSVNPCNKGSHPPPGYACQKAVAVVQPLSQKSNQVTAKNSCPEMFGPHIDSSTNVCVDNTDIHTKTSSHLLRLLTGNDHSEKNSGICSGVPSDLKDQLNEAIDDGIVANSDLTVNQFFTNAMQDTTATLLSNGNGKLSETHQSVTMEASQGMEINKSEVQELELVNVGLLDLIPVIKWTYEKLAHLIAMSTKAQIQPERSEEVVRQLVKHLWDNDFKKLLRLVNTDYYSDLMADVIKFCSETDNSTILSQVENKNCHILKKKFIVLDHDCIHFESPYVSPWLNINEQLDDIDKEFGFPSSLKNSESICNTETEPMETNCGIPVDIVKEKAIEKVPQMAPAPDVEDEVEDIESILTTKCSLSMVPHDALTADLKDPLDLLEIEILPADQARIVFEQLKNESPMLEFKSNEVISATEDTTIMEEFCCINRLMESISGTGLSVGCCCKSRFESNKPCVISTDALLDPSEEENIIEVSLNPMRSNPSEISKIIDLAEEFDVPITHPSTHMDLTEEEEIVNDILSSINKESITLALEKGCNKVELKPACPAETLNIVQPQDHGDDHAAPQSDAHHITEPSDDHTSAPEAVLNIEQKQSNLYDFSQLVQPGSTRLSPTVEPKDDSSFSFKKRLRASTKCKKTKGKKMQTNEDPVASVSQPALKDTSNNIIKEKVDSDESTAAKETVKLALFGSIPHTNSVSFPCVKIHTSCQNFSGRSHQPPSVLTLTRSPVRKRLCEEWRASYLPITRIKRKCKKDINLNSTSDAVAPVEDKHEDMERLPVTPKQRCPIRSVKKRGRRKSTADDLTLETSKMSNKSVTKKQLVNMKSKSKSHKDPDMPLKENSVLRFGKLRNKDGPKSCNDKRDSVLAGWARIPDKKHSLLMFSNVSPHNKTTFQESRKKYMKKRRLIVGSCD